MRLGGRSHVSDSVSDALSPPLSPQQQQKARGSKHHIVPTSGRVSLSRVGELKIHRRFIGAWAARNRRICRTQSNFSVEPVHPSFLAFVGCAGGICFHINAAIHAVKTNHHRPVFFFLIASERYRGSRPARPPLAELPSHSHHTRSLAMKKSRQLVGCPLSRYRAIRDAVCLVTRQNPFSLEQTSVSHYLLSFKSGTCKKKSKNFFFFFSRRGGIPTLEKRPF